MKEGYPMKNTNTNTNTNNPADIMQAIGFLKAFAPMVQAMQAMQAQQAQEQAMGNGDAGKALPVSMPNSKGKAQGKGKAQAQGIAWNAITRQNERQTVYDVRQAMVQGKPFEGLVKAWIVLNEKAVPDDGRVLKVCDDMRCACLQAKGMKVKDAQDAHFEVASMVTVKRAFYCAMRGMPIVETRNDVRPETRGKKAQGK